MRRLATLVLLGGLLAGCPSPNGPPQSAGSLILQVVAKGEGEAGDHGVENKVPIDAGSRYALLIESSPAAYLYAWRYRSGKVAVERLLPPGADATQLQLLAAAWLSPTPWTRPAGTEGASLPEIRDWYTVEAQAGDEQLQVIAATRPLDDKALEGAAQWYSVDRGPPILGGGNRFPGPSYHADLGPDGTARIAFVLRHR